MHAVSFTHQRRETITRADRFQQTAPSFFVALRNIPVQPSSKMFILNHHSNLIVFHAHSKNVRDVVKVEAETMGRRSKRKEMIFDLVQVDVWLVTNVGQPLHPFAKQIDSLLPCDSLDASRRRSAGVSIGEEAHLREDGMLTGLPCPITLAETTPSDACPVLVAVFVALAGIALLTLVRHDGLEAESYLLLGLVDLCLPFVQD
mmetsp:Transcript_33/g.91  ORF Transcript_33/g.91 Transcript_33/m.91 type:complete len:203 (-) Transcript_33:550-1158(-)